MIKFIQNIGDYFSSNYFDEDFIRKVLDKSGYAQEDIKSINKKVNTIKQKYFDYKQLLLEGRLRVKDKVTNTHHFHTELLNLLGYPGNKPQYDDLFHLNEEEVVPVRHILYRGDKPQLMIMEMQPLIKEGDDDPDGLFEQRYHVEEDEAPTSKAPQRYHRSQWENVFRIKDGLKISPAVINKAVSQLFLLEKHHRPAYILLMAGNVIFLLEEDKWFRGSYLQFDLEELFNEASLNRNNYALFYLLLSKEGLAPKADIVLMEQLDEDSHKSAYAVTKDLKEGVIHAVETLANEAVWYFNEQEHKSTALAGTLSHEQETVSSSNGQAAEVELDADKLKDDCLNMVYRLLFLFYAEARQDLDILPSNDEIYLHGYSLEMLRDLEQVPLNTASSQNGYFFHESLSRLFFLLNQGYRERDTDNRSFRVRSLDTPLFDEHKLHYLQKAKIRNVIWQDIIAQLSLSKKTRGRARGRISYANLGINQLGSVYESLLAFRGFFAETDYIEVHRKKKKNNESSEKIAREDGSFLVPRSRMDDFHPDEIYNDSEEGVEDPKVRIIPKGRFVYRLSGRDRQKSASYYTPEVLTQCTVKYTLKPILDRMSERIERGEHCASEILKLKVLEPAMGAAAFHNEVINQLAEKYLELRQTELKQKISPDLYREELQKVKAYIALNNVYGVDINPTAIELGKLSLWLNVMHKDMQTPFFGYRLGVGNAVVGAWLKVYKHKQIEFKPTNKSGTKWEKKEWWNEAPRMLKFIQKGINRKEDEIYHFLLPDINMVPSAGIKMLKDENTGEFERVRDWRKAFCEPIHADEYRLLQQLSTRIDELLEEHYAFQQKINAGTKDLPNIFGVEQPKLSLRSYAEKEELAESRKNRNAPYFKLKRVMDYWCSLWFWDMREADELPSRQEWYREMMTILDFDPKKQAEQQQAFYAGSAKQGDLFRRDEQMAIGFNGSKSKTAEETLQEAMSTYVNEERQHLFASRRQALIAKLSQTYRFFHYQLEFTEVFKERGGFDVIVGNPPWIKMEFEEKGIIAEKFPEVEIRKVSATEVRRRSEKLLEDDALQQVYYAELLEAEGAATFLNGAQNYPLLVGQQTNLYRCIIENTLSLTAEQGFAGLLHPEGIYDDPKADKLRKVVYPRLKYHFQFVNTLKMFQEILHWVTYGVNVYAGKPGLVKITSINNLYHPSTISASLVHNGQGLPGGLKVKDEASGSFTWNINPHKDRIIEFTQIELGVLAKTFEDTDQWKSTKLVSIHTRQILYVLEKLSEFPRKVRDIDFKVSEGFHETNAQDKGIIKRETKYPDIENYELIYSGPHFYVAQPIFKNPIEKCQKPLDYDTIDLTEIPEDYTPRTNYVPEENLSTYASRFKGLKIIGREKETEKPIYDNYLDYYKLTWSRMVSLSGERSLQTMIALPKTAHVNTVNSIIFSKDGHLIEAVGLTSSIILDFFVKTIGKGDIRGSNLASFPLGIGQPYYLKLAVRTLLLNCLTTAYSDLWQNNWQEEFKAEQWSKADARLKSFSALTPEWQWETPLRNHYERRQALVEIDVITAMALGLTLEELILIYEVQFPVLQQNEDDTWYDAQGNIVFTASKGLTGVGLDRKEWEHIKGLQPGATLDCKQFDNLQCNAPGEITHTITKSELYQGKQLTYHAPFDKCDRVEDYKRAWKHFEGVFKQNQTTV